LTSAGSAKKTNKNTLFFSDYKLFGKKKPRQAGLFDSLEI